jgi:crotonobetainyl-CoA:carnitine CoA-transferase CaiB-like acyl-CoA transferase
MTEQMKLPLEGLRILDLTQVMAGPKCTMIMGDLGAEIIKIEPPSGDYSRKMPPHFHRDDSAYYLALNRNKKSMVIDLKQKMGLNIFYDLVKQADIVVDNFRPGVTEKLKINYEVLKSYNEKIISCSITGFGLDSPYAQRPALDLIVQAMGGAMSFTGEPDGPPVRMGIPMGDLAA